MGLSPAITEKTPSWSGCRRKDRNLQGRKSELAALVVKEKCLCLQMATATPPGTLEATWRRLGGRSLEMCSLFKTHYAPPLFLQKCASALPVVSLLLAICKNTPEGCFFCLQSRSAITSANPLLDPSSRLAVLLLLQSTVDTGLNH